MTENIINNTWDLMVQTLNAYRKNTQYNRKYQHNRKSKSNRRQRRYYKLVKQER